MLAYYYQEVKEGALLYIYCGAKEEPFESPIRKLRRGYPSHCFVGHGGALRVTYCEVKEESSK